MEHNTAGAGSMGQTAYKKGGKARRAAGGAKAGPEAGVTLPANEAARTQCEPGLWEEWGRGPEKTPPEENGRLEKGTGAALPAGQRKGLSGLNGKARRAAGGAKAAPEAGVTLPANEAARMQCEPGLWEEWGRGPEKIPPEENGRLEKGTGAALPAGQRKGLSGPNGKARRAAPEAGTALSADEAARKRQAARRTARAAVRIWAARVRRMRDGWPEQEDAIFCPACGCALAQGSLLYFRRGTGACLGCARDVDGHTPFLPACPVCGGALFGDGEAEAPLYTAHGCDFVLGCGRCVAARGAGPLCGE